MIYSLNLNLFPFSVLLLVSVSFFSFCQSLFANCCSACLSLKLPPLIFYLRNKICPLVCPSFPLHQSLVSTSLFVSQSFCSSLFYLSLFKPHMSSLIRQLVCPFFPHSSVPLSVCHSTTLSLCPCPSIFHLSL